MLKLENIEKERFDKYVENHKTKSHFLQSLSWGEFCKIQKKQTPHYLGLVDEKNNIVAATLLLEKKLPLNYSYFYSPRGFVLDYKDKNLFNEMTRQVVNYIKKRKGIFLKIDPDLVKKSTNYLNFEQENSD